MKSSSEQFSLITNNERVGDHSADDADPPAPDMPCDEAASHCDCLEDFILTASLPTSNKL